VSQWPEVELFERIGKLLDLEAISSPGTDNTPVTELRLNDIVIFRGAYTEDIYVLRDGAVVMTCYDGKILIGKNHEDFDYVLAALQKRMVLDDLANV